jgi:glycerol kinase
MPDDEVDQLRTGWSKAVDRARAWEDPDTTERRTVDATA